MLSHVPARRAHALPRAQQRVRVACPRQGEPREHLRGGRWHSCPRPLFLPPLPPPPRAGSPFLPPARSLPPVCLVLAGLTVAEQNMCCAVLSFGVRDRRLPAVPPGGRCGRCGRAPGRPWQALCPLPGALLLLRAPRAGTSSIPCRKWSPAFLYVLFALVGRTRLGARWGRFADFSSHSVLCRVW